jgi:hypothetical protein
MGVYLLLSEISAVVSTTEQEKRFREDRKQEAEM